MESTNKKRLVMIGIRRKGEKGFKITRTLPTVKPFMMIQSRNQKEIDNAHPIN